MEDEADEEVVFLLANKIKDILTFWGIPAVIASISQSFFGEAILSVISRFDFWFGVLLGSIVGFVTGVFVYVLYLRRDISIATLRRNAVGGFTKEDLFIGLSVFVIIAGVVGLVNMISGPVIGAIVGISILVFVLLVRGKLAKPIAVNLMVSGIVTGTRINQERLSRYAEYTDPTNTEFHKKLRDQTKDYAEEIDSVELYSIAANWHVVARHIDVYEIPLVGEREAIDWLIDKIKSIEEVDLSEDGKEELRYLLTRESDFIAKYQDKIEKSDTENNKDRI